jgi:hypothetical protein
MAMRARRDWLAAACLCVLPALCVAAARADDAVRDVWVNGPRMSADEILTLEDHFGLRLRDGAYLYDPETGDFRATAMSRLKSDGEVGDPQYAAFQAAADPVGGE